MSKSCSRAVRLHRQGFFQQVHISILFEPPLMPFIDLAFRLKPVGQVRDRVDAKVHALAGQFALPSSLSRQHGELTRSFLEFLIYSFGWWLRLTLSSGSSKRKTIATQSPEFGVAIAGALDAGEKLMS